MNSKKMKTIWCLKNVNPSIILFNNIGRIENNIVLEDDQKYLNLMIVRLTLLKDLIGKNQTEKGLYVRKIVERMKQSQLFTKVLLKLC